MSLYSSEEDKIEKLKKRLFDNDISKLRKTHRGTMHDVDLGVPNEWENKVEVKNDNALTIEPKMKSTIFKKLFIGSIAFFVIAVTFVVYSFMGGRNIVSNDNVDIAILGNAFTNGGDELPLQIEIHNKNSVAIEFANLNIEYPKGSESGGVGEMERKSESIGTIEAGKTFTYDARVILFGEQGSIKDIKATLEYRVKNSNAILQKSASFSVALNSAPLELTVKGPTDTTPGQNFSLDVTALLKSVNTAKDMILKIEYPPGYNFVSANPAPSIGNNVWNLGDLSQGIPKTITVSGSIIAPEGEDRAFRIFAGEKSADDESIVGTVFNSMVQVLAIRKPFIEAHIAINGANQSPYVVSAGSDINVGINWANNLPTRVDNLQITAKISGNAYDESTIKNQTGFYDSVKDSMVWDQNTMTSFATVEPGDSGQVNFSLSPSLSSVLNSPGIKIEVSISGRQPQYGTGVARVDNFETADIRVGSDFQIGASAVYGVGPFTNTGGIPPRAEKPTTYTITWSLTNSSNRISGASATTKLPSYVKWTNLISPTNENITYNDATREVIWNIGSVDPGTGFTGKNKTVSFQVELTPSKSQIGSSPILIDKTTLVGQDSFTGANISPQPKSALNTRIQNDPTFTQGSEKVVQ